MNNLRFNLLFKVAQIIVLIPHAGIERVFSLVNKKKKNAWTGTDWIVMELSQTILSVKLAQPESRSKCFDYQPSKTV